MKTDTVRPFDFADLQGKPEPESWGPVYPKTASAAVEKWRKVSLGRELTAQETAAYGDAVGQWIRALNQPAGHKPLSLKTTAITCAQIRAACKARFAADAARDRREWALGKLKDAAGHTIGQAYDLAMAAKRNRLRARSCGLEAVRAALFGAVEYAEAA
jgi:hypothetical protein